ncbi:hypothetical protein ACFLT9_12570 [Acidobacteriota bacterium]
MKRFLSVFIILTLLPLVSTSFINSTPQDRETIKQEWDSFSRLYNRVGAHINLQKKVFEGIVDEKTEDEHYVILAHMDHVSDFMYDMIELNYTEIEKAVNLTTLGFIVQTIYAHYNKADSYRKTYYKKMPSREEDLSIIDTYIKLLYKIWKPRSDYYEKNKK